MSEGQTCDRPQNARVDFRTVYVASSWRNEQQPAAVKLLRAAGHEVYDFRHPAPGYDGFSWSRIDPHWRAWSSKHYMHELYCNPLARRGYEVDYTAMQAADTCVLMLPCGRSAHLEAGWFAGAGRELWIVLGPEPAEAELMYRMATGIVSSIEELLSVWPILANR